MSADQQSCVATLIERLTDAELTVRVHAGLLLGTMGEEAKPALAALWSLRQSEDTQNRRLAVMTLGSLAHDLAEAVPPLLSALEDEDEAVRRLAAEALDELAPPYERLKVALNAVPGTRSRRNLPAASCIGDVRCLMGLVTKERLLHPVDTIGSHRAVVPFPSCPPSIFGSKWFRDSCGIVRRFHLRERDMADTKNGSSSGKTTGGMIKKEAVEKGLQTLDDAATPHAVAKAHSRSLPDRDGPQAHLDRQDRDPQRRKLKQAGNVEPNRGKAASPAIKCSQTSRTERGAEESSEAKAMACRALV